VPAITVTYVFSDIEGSTRLWDAQPERMAPALARHDALVAEAVAREGGRLIKMIGDGMHAVFDDAAGALRAVVELQAAMAEPPEGVLPLRMRFGLHRGAAEHRDGDVFGVAVNRAARVMACAHGGQVLVTQAVADSLDGRLPQGITLRDLGVVRLRDLSAPERVLQVEHASLRADFPALRSLASTPNNLPQQLNAFIGRERESAEVRAALGQHRLVTLLAMGGIGKSRLSVQLGAELLDDYPDGVWLVELAPVADAGGVPQAVATVLGVREEPGGTVTDALLKFVRDRKLLLILDNCEHLVPPCAELAKALLQAGPQVTLLATSRDALQIAGEASYQLEPLGVPAAHATPDPDTLRQQDAVRLFIERATAAQPAFRLTAANAPAVAAICAQLDGIPLALELAAARVRTLTVEVIAARLADRFKLLVSQDRTVLPRQRTLRALIDWSYDLLSDAEKTLFARLSVFAGGWTLEAAEAVGAGGEIESGDVLDLLARLVEKSLVRMDAETGRYRMLETVKAYAREKVEASGDLEGAVERHLQFFAEFANKVRPLLAGAEQRTWMRRVDLDHDNLQAAHLSCAGRPERAKSDLTIVRSLKFFWIASGRLAVGLRMSLEALAGTSGAEPSFDRAAGLRDAGMLCHFSGKYAQALELLDEGIVEARRIGEVRVLPTALHVASIVSLAVGQSELALRYCDEAAEVAVAVGYKHAHAGVLNTRGQVLRFIGELDAAREPLERSLAIVEELGDEQGATNALLNIAMIDVDQGRLGEASQRLTVAVNRCKRLDSPVLLQALLDTCGALLVRLGRATYGLQLIAAADQLGVETGSHRDPADNRFVQQILASAGEVGTKPISLDRDFLLSLIDGALASSEG
jgi:predicted ATPase